MTHLTLKRFVNGIVLGLLLCTAGAGLTQDYPTKPVRIVTGFPPGGGADLVARILADQLTKQLGGQFVVVNTVGASGTIAAGAVSKAEPDGYTLLLATTPFTLSPQLYKSVPYDALKGFTPIARVGDGPFGIVVQSQSSLQSISDVIAAARAKPGAINYGSGGTASTSQFAGELIKIMGKVDIQNIAYTGLPAALAALMGGQIDLAIADLPAVTGHVRAGRLRMLAVTSAQRIPMLPGVPTVAESGLPGYDVAIWYGLLAPDALPRPVRDRLQGAIAAIFKAPDKALLDQFTALGIVATPLNTPEQFADFIKTDFAFWKKLVTDAGVKPN
ncbi:MAG: tripartite tricarboxylate transporter substrate-binding protein [Proteobacteria bacterium]|nr:tripartite tricarboxylate transporter substrate-binding protein [Pseudomonadota bacterium]